MFTAREPRRWINERQLIDLIHGVANRRLEELSGERRFIESPEVILDDLRELREVAVEISGEKLTDSASAEEVFSNVFDTDALEQITSKCLNRYWMWYLLSKLRTNTFPVPLLAIARAHARARDALYDNRFGFAWVTPLELIWRLKGMPPGFVIELWETGQLLSTDRKDANGYSLRLNPLLIDD